MVLTGAQTLFGQLRPQALEERTTAGCESRRYMQTRLRSASDSSIDVQYYKVNLRISTAPGYLNGVVTMRALTTVANLSTLSLDLMNTMTVDSVKCEDNRLSFVRHPAAVAINLNRSYGLGEMVVLDIYYRGIPLSTGFGSFEFGNHADIPWVWTLSEPYGAKDWWPCKDHPSDKADSVDIWVTCQRDFKVASNGKLLAIVNNPDSTHTYKWAERYPIASYLVFVSLTNYAEFTNWFRYSPTDSMPVLNYVLPEHLAAARDSFPKVVDMLRIFSGRLGLYPFINEKYGHAQFGRGGAMEHQTMTSLIRASFDENTLAHELGHQWFGDLITCASWQHLWLNEGFASYCQAIYAEGAYGTSAYRNLMQQIMSIAKTGSGSVFRADTSNILQLFDHRTVYRKGASTLHMLRHVLGDSIFFLCLQRYVADPRFRFGVATTTDFQNVCEFVSGRPLGWFFTQWIYGEKYPDYSFTWNAAPDTAGGYFLSITVTQTTGTTNPPFFIMPIDFKVSSAAWDTTVVLFNTTNPQQFRVRIFRQPTSVELDPGNWILKDVTQLSSADFSMIVPAKYSLEQNFPNPFNPSTKIRFSIPSQQLVSLRVFDLLGKEVRTLANGEMPAGVNDIFWDAGDVASGVYLYRLQTKDFTATKKCILVR